MKKEEPLVVLPGDHEETLNVVGTKVTVLKTGEPNDVPHVTYQAGEEGTGPPPHSHVWDESFFVTKGVVNFVCDGETFVCPKGSFVHVPAGTVHAFTYGPGGGELLEFTGEKTKAVSLFRFLDGKPPPPPEQIEDLNRFAKEEFDVAFHI